MGFTKDRMRTIKSYNLDIYNPLLTDGFYEFPIIGKETFIPDDLISFNYAKNRKILNCGVHMFVDDYQFERIWNKPYRYIEMLKKFQCVLTPDFSLYRDMPRALKVWNVYRSRLIGQFMQREGLCVIPTISWSEPETYSFCFDGIEYGGTVAIATTGCLKSSKSKTLWHCGVDAMIEAIAPKTILIYGQPIEHDFKNTKVVYFKNKQIERCRSLDGR